MNDVVEIAINNSAFPPLLKQIHTPPQKLYVRGNVAALQNENTLAVVGSRAANTYGQQACALLLPAVVRAGVVLVSGLAHGIDSLAHRACVDEDRPTIAVLGSGPDDNSIYPHTNTKLVRRIVEAGGAVVTEYPPGTKARRGQFPFRNRIIVGLSRAVLLIQAAKRSGSLITTRLAAEENRDVLAVPGMLTSELSFGPNQLIKNGAALVTTSEDILAALGFDSTPAGEETSSDVQPALLLTSDQQNILNQLSDQPTHLDTIAEKTSLSAHHTSATLIELELAGHIQNVGGMRYIRKI